MLSLHRMLDDRGIWEDGMEDGMKGQRIKRWSWSAWYFPKHDHQKHTRVSADLRHVLRACVKGFLYTDAMLKCIDALHSVASSMAMCNS